MPQKEILNLCQLEPEVVELLAIYCAETVNPHRLAEWFTSVNFESLRPEVSCLASTAAAQTAFNHVPQELIPRLRGMQKYIHTLTAGVMGGLLSLCKEFALSNIPMLLTQETGLYIENPNVPQRSLWNTRIGLLPEDFHNAIHIAENLGYTVKKEKFAAVLQKSIMQNYVLVAIPGQQWIWDCAETVKSNSMLRPRYGAMLISLCQSGFRTLLSQNPKTGIVTWGMDMHLLLKKMDQEEWLAAAKIAKEEHAGRQMAFMLSLYHYFSNNSDVQQQIKLFDSGNRNAQLYHAIRKLKTLPPNGHKLSKHYLRCRLSRPDSILETLKLMLHTGEAKITH